LFAVLGLLLGRHAEALRDYDELHARGGEKAPDLIGRGAALVALKRNAEALAPLQRGTELLPNDAEGHTQYGVALLRLSRYAEALASFEAALAIAPDDAETLFNQAVALGELGHIAQ